MVEGDQASEERLFAEGNLTCDKIVRKISLVTENPRRKVFALNVYPYPNPIT